MTQVPGSSAVPTSQPGTAGNLREAGGDWAGMSDGLSTPPPPAPAPPVRRPRPTGRARPVRLVAVMVAVVVAIAVALVALRLTDDGRPQAVTIGRTGQDAAVLQIDSGADTIMVSTADLGDDSDTLAVVSTPDGEHSGVRPRARLDNGRLRVWTEDTGDADGADGAAVTIDVRIAAGVRWDVLVDKGAKQIRLALGSGRVRAVELRGGADRAEVSLPEPEGELVVRVPTGLSAAGLHLPPGRPAEVRFGSGAGRVVVDGAQQQGIAAGTTIYGATGKAGTNGAKGYAAAKDRFLVDVAAGVGTLTLDRTRQ